CARDLPYHYTGSYYQRILDYW
nr:immunoglobulin heavy chain junction region [Macaca mulatta]MOW32583.1 immunoglobulin heavy chain junction region [Macaca mulatta]MOW33468.1 immunoglobulin heavy chain junction region [Macaca mulatta]